MLGINNSITAELFSVFSKYLNKFSKHNIAPFYNTHNIFMAQHLYREFWLTFGHFHYAPMKVIVSVFFFLFFRLIIT